MVGLHQTDWDEKLLAALWAYRTAFKVATGLTPFKLAFGMEAITPSEFIVPSLRLAIADRLLPAEDSLLYRLEAIQDLEEDRMRSFYLAQEVQQRRKRFVDRYLRKRIFEKGHLVLVFTARMFKKPTKLTVRWSGPFWVYAICGPTSYFLANFKGEVLPSPVNAFRMRHYHAAAPLQCPFSTTKEGAHLVMMICPEVNSGIISLPPAGSEVYMQQGMHFFEYKLIIRQSSSCSLLLHLSLSCKLSALSFSAFTMTASPAQFQSLVPITHLDMPARSTHGLWTSAFASIQICIGSEYRCTHKLFPWFVSLL